MRDTCEETVQTVLLTNPHFGPEAFLFFDNNPLARAPQKPPIHLEDLNTGDAHLETCAKLEEGWAPFPILFCIDGAVTGQFSDLPLTPVKIALGIHKRETRDKHHAWREIGWMPQVRKQKATGKKTFKESGHLEARNMTVMAGEGQRDRNTHTARSNCI